MSQDGSWRRSTWTPPKPFKSSVISKQAGRLVSTGAPFNSPTRPARLPDWHLRRLSRRRLSHLIVFLPLNPEEFTTLGESAQSFIRCCRVRPWQAFRSDASSRFQSKYAKHPEEVNQLLSAA